MALNSENKTLKYNCLANLNGNDGVCNNETSPNTYECSKGCVVSKEGSERKLDFSLDIALPYILFTLHVHCLDKT